MGMGVGMVVTLRRKVQAEVNVACTWATLCQVCVGATAVWTLLASWAA